MSKPLFTTKHYKAIAKWFLDSKFYSLGETEVAKHLAKDNPKFDLKKFVREIQKKQDEIK